MTLGKPQRMPVCRRRESLTRTHRRTVPVGTEQKSDTVGADSLAEPAGQLFDFRNLALSEHRPWPTVDRRLGLVRVQCRRHPDLGIPEFSGFPS